MYFPRMRKFSKFRAKFYKRPGRQGGIGARQGGSGGNSIRREHGNELKNELEKNIIEPVSVNNKCTCYRKEMVIHMKKKIVRRILASAMTLAMVLGMAACGNGGNAGGQAEGRTEAESAGASESGEKVVLNVINYHVGTDYAAEYYAYLFEEFQKTEEGKNVEFNFEEIPTTDAYNQKIKLLISSGDLPDIVFNGGNNIT